MDEGKLCDQCKHTFSKEGVSKLWDREDVLFSLDKLAQTSAAGCRFCQMIKEHPDMSKIQPPPSLTLRISRGTSPLILEAFTTVEETMMRNSTSRDTISNVLRFTLSVPATTFEAYIRYHTGLEALTTNFRDESVYKSINSWIHECQQKHSYCNRNIKPLQPSRLLDVSLNSESGKIKLHVTKDSENNKGDYVTLSYCWGGSQKICLRNDNLEELKSGIEINSLPQTIQDAIEVTRKLNVRFLWVDALCILQDDSDDQLKEIQNMGEIYKDSLVTIAASNCKGVADGFLESSFSKTKTLEFDLHIAPGRHPYLPEYIGPLIVKVHVRPIILNSQDFALDKRGWPFQEKFLSGRMLQFTGEDIVFKCRTHGAYQTINGNLADVTYMYDIGPINFWQATNATSYEFDPMEKIDLWMMVVNQYTARSLTDPEDRLHGLAGIANLIKLRFPEEDNYMYGLWQRYLHTELCWISDGSKGRLKRSARAPTWSWASLDSHVFYPAATKLTDIYCSNVYNYLREKDVSISVVPGSNPENTRELKVKTTIVKYDLSKSLPNQETMRIFYDLDVPEFEGNFIQCAILGLEHHSKFATLFGLALARTDSDSFRRVGFFAFSQEELNKTIDPAGVTTWRDVERQEFILV